MIPFGFWKKNGINFPSHPCASISGTQTFSSNTTMDDAAIAAHQCKNWVVNTGVTLTFATTTQAPIGSLTLNGTAKITHSQCTTAQCFQVNIYANGDVTIGSSAKIHADAQGYLGGNLGGNANCKGRTIGNTTTGGASCGSTTSDYAAGGSFGGYGGLGIWGEPPNGAYGSILNPADHGSGGAGDPAGSGYKGGAGGGVIRLLVTGVLTIDGLVSSNGGTASSYGGGGSGGSIWITAATLATSSAGLRITANGGSGTSSNYGNGGGGRIALEYNSLSTFAISNTFVNTFGLGSTQASARAHAGTIYATNGVSAKLYFHNNGITAPTVNETPISESLTVESMDILGNAIVKQTSSANTITIQNTITVTAPALMKVPNNGTINNAGPWTWFTYGSVAGIITEY